MSLNHEYVFDNIAIIEYKPISPPAICDLSGQTAGDRDDRYERVRGTSEIRWGVQGI
jgi:hypothetical protein